MDERIFKKKLKKAKEIPIEKWVETADCIYEAPLVEGFSIVIYCTPPKTGDNYYELELFKVGDSREFVDKKFAGAYDLGLLYVKVREGTSSRAKHMNELEKLL